MEASRGAVVRAPSGVTPVVIRVAVIRVETPAAVIPAAATAVTDRATKGQVSADTPARAMPLNEKENGPPRWGPKAQRAVATNRSTGRVEVGRRPSVKIDQGRWR